MKHKIGVVKKLFRLEKPQMPQGLKEAMWANIQERIVQQKQNRVDQLLLNIREILFPRQIAASLMGVIIVTLLTYGIIASNKQESRITSADNGYLTYVFNDDGDGVDGEGGFETPLETYFL